MPRSGLLCVSRWPPLLSPEVWQWASGWPSNQSGVWHLQVLQARVLGPRNAWILPCQSPLFPSVPQRAMHTRNKTNTRIKVQEKTSYPVRLANWWIISFKEQNHGKCISKPTLSIYIFFKTHKCTYNKNCFWLLFQKLLILSSFFKYMI